MKREGGWVAQIMTARHLYTTAEFADPDNRPNYEGGVAIRGNDYKVLYIIGIVIGGCLLLGRLVPVIPGILGTLGYVGIMYTLDHYVPAAHRELIFDHQGMIIQKDRIQWRDVIGTFIWTTTGATGYGTFTAFQLVIVDQWGILTFYAVGEYLVSVRVIASLVEYYRSPAPIA